MSADQRPSFTGPQRTAILRDDHTLLEAGAGSGKTYTLVNKILHALGASVVPGAPRVVNPCSLGEIAAVTFTTAAAADLKKSLRAALRQHADTSGERQWRRMVNEVDRARIGTIHGFCSRLLREFGIRVRIDPGFRVLDEGDAAAMREEAVRARVYRALREGDHAATEVVFEVGPEACIALVTTAVSRGDATRDAYERWCERDGAPRLPELQAALGACGGTWRDGVDDDAVRMGATLLRLAAESRAELDARLAAEGAMDYDALIYRTRELLRERDDVLAAVRARLRWLFIDEFQDTDRAQRDIAYRICGIGDERATDSPRLVLVGDPKQSIYGFRRADVTLWKEVARDFAALGAAPIALDTSFRSRQPLVSYVNGAFERVMAPGESAALREFEVEFRPLVAQRSYASDDNVVEVLALPEGSADERRTAEATLIARRVRKMVDEQESVARNGDERRRVTWKDIALLFRASSDIGLYEDALRRHGIPCYRPSGDGFFATREVRDVMLLLRALCDSRDDIAWFGLLRSPLVGLSDEGILRLRVARPEAAFSELLDVSLPGEDGPVLRAASRWIGELRDLRDRIGCAALIDRALERSGYSALLLYIEGGDIAVANLRKLVRMADGRPDASLSELVRYLDRRAELAAREAAAPLHTAGEDVVILTTIHGAKGLEWPVVFLCDLDRAPRAGKDAPHLLCDRDVGVALKLEVDQGGDEPTLPGSWEALRDGARERDLAEEKRVWYVAATRAMDRLVMCAIPGAAQATTVDDDGQTVPLPPTPSRWLLGGATFSEGVVSYSGDARTFSGAVCAAVDGEFATVAPAAPPRSDDAAAAGSNADIARRIAEVTSVSPLFRRSATELMLFRKSRDDHRRAYHLGLRPSVLGTHWPSGAGGTTTSAPSAATSSTGPTRSTAIAGALDARSVGEIVHLALEVNAVDRDLDNLLQREVGSRLGWTETASAASTIARVRATVESARAHPSVRRMLVQGAEHELAFTWLVSTATGPSVVHGAMDLVSRVDGALEILDFKTHGITTEAEAIAAADGYVLQRNLYAAALHDLVDTPSAFSFLFTATQGEVRSELDAETIATERARLLELLSDAQRGGS